MTWATPHIIKALIRDKLLRILYLGRPGVIS